MPQTAPRVATRRGFWGASIPLTLNRTGARDMFDEAARRLSVSVLARIDVRTGAGLFRLTSVTSQGAYYGIPYGTRKDGKAYLPPHAEAVPLFGTICVDYGEADWINVHAGIKLWAKRQRKAGVRPATRDEPVSFFCQGLTYPKRRAA